MAPTYNDDFELSDGSYFVSDIYDYIEYIENMKHQQQFVLFMFTSTELIIDKHLK